MPTAPAEPKPRLALSAMVGALEIFRTHWPDAPVYGLVIFLHVAKGRGITAEDLLRVTGLSQSSVSRNIHVLGRGRKGEPGLHLIAQTIDPVEPRRFAMRLTARGKALADALVAAVGNAGGRQQEVERGPAEPPVDRLRGVHWENWMD